MFELEYNAQRNFKYRDLKIYGSSEWLANESKKYRRVYDRAETTYIYAELSFVNKFFDQEDWKANIAMRAYIVSDKKEQQLCELVSEKNISRDTNVVYVREGWGNKKPGFFWKPGEYKWEAHINGELVAVKKFWVTEVGLVTDDHNPFFSIEAIKLFEGPNDTVPPEEREYCKVFDAKETRYIFAELHCKNLASHKDWMCELEFKFLNNANQLKGSTSELVRIGEGDDRFLITSGWGANDKGTWFPDRYSLELLFMDHRVAILPFQVGDAFEEGLNEVILPGTGSKIIPGNAGEPQSFEEVMADLEELIGLETIKARIKDYAQYLQFLKLRVEKGFEDIQKLNLHAVFTGNPGTGKTTVAKMLGQIYKQMGLLTKGHVYEAGRAELVGEYIGQTAPKVKEAIKQARGGILFIDEAYSLARSKDDLKDFGREVIEILVKEMSDGEGDLAVILAGYPGEMRTFVDSNPGMHSRINQWFDFPDYLPQELADIAEYACKKQNILLSPQAKAYLYQKIVDAYRNRTRFFGNARHINSIIGQAKVNMGLRIMKTENPHALSNEALSTILVNDLEPIFKASEKRIPDIPIDENLLQLALEELDELTGLESVKKDIRELVQLVRFYREENKEVLNRFSLHSVFTGNPGTGKTTVARILAKIFKALGVLERGHLVECDRQSLVAGFVGQTAIKTAEKIDEAIGGVLFIDEAYALTQRGANDFGREAIETLIKRMEDQKGEFAIVTAGYPDNMKLFMESNPGLKSRFDRVLKFEDFSPGDLLLIAQELFKKQGYDLKSDAEKLLSTYLNHLHDNKDKFFGNGRTVVKTVEEIVKNQNLRLAALSPGERNENMLKTITAADLHGFDERKAVSGGRKRLGFGGAAGSV